MLTARCPTSSLLPGLLFLVFSVGIHARVHGHEPQSEFQVWLAAVIVEAREQGIRQEVIVQALGAVTTMPKVISNDRIQAEFTETFEQYREKRVTICRI